MSKTHNIASFVLRFTQDIWQDASGEPHVQWRGHIRHVQGDEEDRFTDFAEAVAFIQHYLTQLTVDSLAGGPSMSQEKVIRESFKFWEQFASSYTDMMFEAMEHTIKQSETFREQIEEIGERALQAWQPSNQSDQNQILAALNDLQAQVQALAKKLEDMEKALRKTTNE